MRNGRSSSQTERGKRDLVVKGRGREEREGVGDLARMAPEPKVVIQAFLKKDANLETKQRTNTTHKGYAHR